MGSFWLFSLLLIVGLNAEEEVLKPGRKFPWVEKGLNFGPELAQPEQIHLSYGGTPSTLFVTWITLNDTGDSFVDYGKEETFGTRSPATITQFRDTVFNSYRYTHRATIEGIEAGQKYYYRVGSEYALSNVFSFKGLQERSDGGYRFAVYGDFGLINARSLGRLQNLTQFGDFDAVLHIGDFGYDMNFDDGQVGDKFFRTIEPIASKIPYMSIPGNHEFWFNFTQYRNRFSMPNSNQNLFYSFDIGTAHIIGFTTEIYHAILDKKNQLKTQYNWLVNDLEAANKNRGSVPWIIVMGHRPMYCTTTDIFSECQNPGNELRVGLPFTHEFGLEELFYNQGVDLQIYGHEHNYERLYPVYDNVVYNGTSNPYVDPPAPVHVITGSAGCQENTDAFKKPAQVWDAYRSSDYGFSRMQIYNKTHLYFEQVRSWDGLILDSFTLVKNSHGPFTQKQREQLEKYGHRVERKPITNKNVSP